jgi:hypothetical protein
MGIFGHKQKSEEDEPDQGPAEEEAPPEQAEGRQVDNPLYSTKFHPPGPEVTPPVERF